MDISQMVLTLIMATRKTNMFFKSLSFGSKDCIKELKLECAILTLNCMSALSACCVLDFHCKRSHNNGSLCFEFLFQQMSQSKKKYIDLCHRANKYNQVVLETLS